MPDVSLAGLLLRLAVSMTVVIALMLLAARMLRRSAAGMGIRGGPRGGRERPATIEVAALQHLTKTAHVAVVHVAGREMVVGVTDQQVTLLHSSPQHGQEVEAQQTGSFDLSADATSSITESSHTSSSAWIAIEDPAGAATADTAGQSAWTDTLKSLRERTVRR